MHNEPVSMCECAFVCKGTNKRRGGGRERSWIERGCSDKELRQWGGGGGGLLLVSVLAGGCRYSKRVQAAAAYYGLSARNKNDNSPNLWFVMTIKDLHNAILTKDKRKTTMRGKVPKAVFTS